MKLENLLLLGAAVGVGYLIAKKRAEAASTAAQTQAVAMMAPVPSDQVPQIVEQNFFLDEYGPGWGWGPGIFAPRGHGGGHGHGGHGGHGGHHGGHH